MDIFEAAPELDYNSLIVQLYLDWRNNFLSVERFAEYHNFRVEYAEILINVGRDVLINNRIRSAEQ